jgi:hypothetical protein
MRPRRRLDRRSALPSAGSPGLVQVPQCRQYRALGLAQFVHLAR